MKKDYNIIDLLGYGTFGKVYRGTYKKNDVAIKITKQDIKTNNHKALILEFRIYKKLIKSGIKCIPKIYSLIKTNKFYMMVMEIFDNDATKIKFNGLGVLLKFSIDVLKIIKQIHSTGILHRDIKPSNFLMKNGKLSIIDFGLAKKYLVADKHINYNKDKFFLGTAKYASIHSHKKYELSRRDDLYSIFYMIMYILLRRKLPWDETNREFKDELKELKLEKNDEEYDDELFKKEDKTTKMLSEIEEKDKKNLENDNKEKIRKLKIKKLTRIKKENFDISKYDVPACYVIFWKYITKLKFDEEPKYDKYITIFKKYGELKKIVIGY